MNADYSGLGRLWTDGVPDNDLEWLAGVGLSRDPPRHLYMQHLARLLRQWSSATFGSAQR